MENEDKDQYDAKKTFQHLTISNEKIPSNENEQNHLKLLQVKNNHRLYILYVLQ